MKYATPPDDLPIKSIKEVIDSNTYYKGLIIYVLSNLGDLEDKEIYYDIDSVAKNGANGGYGKYIYYSDMIDWLSNRRLQREISLYFKNWLDDEYSISEDDSSYMLDEIILELNLPDRELTNRFDTKLFKETFLLCKDSPYFKNKNYNGKEFIMSAYQIYRYINNKNVDLSGTEATFISWFVLEGVSYMFIK